jgi:hypothetical protein
MLELQSRQLACRIQLQTHLPVRWSQG